MASLSRWLLASRLTPMILAIEARKTFRDQAAGYRACGAAPEREAAGSASLRSYRGG